MEGTLCKCCNEFWVPLVCYSILCKGPILCSLNNYVLPSHISITLFMPTVKCLPPQIGRVGRADTMGLAISLVSEVPEKVWFCTVKGLKPWMAPDSSNTLTTDKGGHTTW